MEAVTASGAPEILGASIESEDKVPDLQEVTIELSSGAVLIGRIKKSDVGILPSIEEVSSFSESNNLAYAEMTAEETELDKRLLSVRDFTNNIPCLQLREHVHREYIKRKRAYVAALEATIEGILRRPK